MKVKGLSIDSSVEGEQSVTHELLAAVLARYSRSNDGIDVILNSIDKNNTDKSIDRIFKFIDYGHASIGGLTGGIAIAMDNISMWLAYKVFEISQMADGQESSTRYITMNESSLPQPEELGIPDDLAEEWKQCMSKSFRAFTEEYEKLQELSIREPERMRLPVNASNLMTNRLRKNYILDRARYFIPFATKTNMALVQSARMWCQTITHLASMPQLEAQNLANHIRDEINKFCPRLIKHSYAEESYINSCSEELRESCILGLQLLSTDCKNEDEWLHVNNDIAPWNKSSQTIQSALSSRKNRYGFCGRKIRQMQVSFGWGNIAIAEMRDLNRHRTGCRYTPMIQTGFYTPPEINRDLHTELLNNQQQLMRKLLERNSPAYVYCLLLGSQTQFEHSTHADKFIYEAELRTGFGAHFRYAQHLHSVLLKFYDAVPESRSYILEGTAEPE